MEDSSLYTTIGCWGVVHAREEQAGRKMAASNNERTLAISFDLRLGETCTILHMYFVLLASIKRDGPVSWSTILSCIR